MSRFQIVDEEFSRPSPTTKTIYVYPTKWEHKIFSAEPITNQTIEKATNELGQEGWEYVSTVLLDQKNNRLYFIAKRPAKQED